MTHQHAIRKMILAGYSCREIASELSQLTPGTIQQYFYRVKRELSQEDRARADKARSERKHQAPRPLCRQPFAERNVLSSFHIRLGVRLNMSRSQQQMGLSEFCDNYSFSNPTALSAMEQGFHDFKLTEIVRLSEILEIPVHVLMEPPECSSRPVTSSTPSAPTIDYLRQPEAVI